MIRRDGVDDAGEVLGDDSACRLGEGLADFRHGAASGGADVDDEGALLSLAGGGEGGEFGVEGVDADGGDGEPVALRDGRLVRAWGTG